MWHEVGRPQVHGYDLACICSLGKYSFASGAEEKVIRGFVAPANFIRNFGQICGIDVEDDLGEKIFKFYLYINYLEPMYLSLESKYCNSFEIVPSEMHLSLQSVER